MKRCTSLRIAPLLGIVLLSTSCGSSGGSGGGSPACSALTGYTATVSTPYSFAKDIQPILSNPGSCGIATACHGTPGIAVDKAGTKMQSFTGAPATVLTLLKGPSVNDPSMNLVTAGSVGKSFLVYKLSGTDALACSSLACAVGASTTSSAMIPCGGPMPVVGYPPPSASDITKIKDWIALGAQP